MNAQGDHSDLETWKSQGILKSQGKVRENEKVRESMLVQFARIIFGQVIRLTEMRKLHFAFDS